jgi:hypothetical protein
MGILEWTIVETPGSSSAITKEILNPNNQGSEINRIVIAPDGNTIWAIVRRGDRKGITQGGAQVMMYVSTDLGISWSENAYASLARVQSSIANGTFVWDIAIAPDNRNVIAVACADIVKSPLAQEIWISNDGGNIWENTHWPPPGVVQSTDLISAMDISVNSSGYRILVGTRDGQGTDTNNLQVLTLSYGSTWSIQDASGISPSTNPITGDILAVKFSPTFASDSTIVVVYTDGRKDHAGTWLATGNHSIANNSTHWQKCGQHIEIRNSNGKVGDSPCVDEIITAQLQLPFDFDGRFANSRRYYICTDAINRSENLLPNRGVYRIDNTAIFTLMDNTDKFGPIASSELVKRAYSIAYFGTCKSGKLLVGDVLGHSLTATVPVWFTYSPEGQVEDFWFPSLKPPTGAARPLPYNSTGNTRGYGNAQVAWSPDGQLAFAATGSASLGPWATPIIDDGAIVASMAWPSGYVNVVPFDESALSLSRSNGQIWNQLSIIDTAISYLNDVAPTPDGQTIYLASANCEESSDGFDSVWRSSSNPAITSPLPLGTHWERILTRRTAYSHQESQSKRPLLRVAGGCTEPTGGLVGWAAQGTKAQAWSPDYGDYWAIIVPRDIIQDFCFESNTILYNLTPTGLVQKMSFNGFGWSTALPSYNSGISKAHTIAAYPEGKILVGAAADFHREYYAVSFSTNIDTNNPTFQTMTTAGKTPFMGDVHVAFHPNFTDNSIIFISDEAYADGNGVAGGSVYRNNLSAPVKWEDADMLRFADTAISGNAYNKQPQSGLVLSFTKEALYSCYVQWPETTMGGNSGVLRTIDDGTGNYGPLSGMRQPGISWDNLSIYNQSNIVDGIRFGVQPTALRACGCCIGNTDTTLYAIDSREYAPDAKRGMLWSYTDCMAKKGPQPVTSEGIIIGCDVRTGRNREIVFAWEQLCIASDYQIQIARDKEFSALVTDTGIFRPASLNAPAFVYLGGGGSTVPATVLVPALECGQTYYWRCKAHAAHNGEKVRSPWSEVRSFTIEGISTATASGRLPMPTTDRRVRIQLPRGKRYHFFLAHASEDKDWAGPLANYLRGMGFKVWYDDFIIKIGHSVPNKIEEGLSQSLYGILVLSHNFFKEGKRWPRRELDGLIALEDQEGRSLILPILHNIKRSDITKHVPSLASIRCLNSSMDYRTIADNIIEAISA